jgi:hypothetical protein
MWVTFALLDPDRISNLYADPDPATQINADPDPCKKKIKFFLITCPHAHHLQSNKIKFLLKFCLEKFDFAGIISVRSTHLWEKGRIRVRTSY